MRKKGRFIGIGVGPGDPELITLKAVRTIEACGVLAAPRTIRGDMIALDIVRQAVDLSGKEIVPVEVLMQRDPEKRRKMYEGIFAQISAFLDEGRDVAMVTLGDVTIYSTVAYVLDELKARGYATGMVPGVASFSAVAARLGTGLTKRDEPLVVIPASAGDLELEQYLKLRGTKVLMKSGKQLGSVLRILGQMGLLESSSMVINCGMAGERVCESLAGVDAEEIGAGYFVTVIVAGKAVPECC